MTGLAFAIVFCALLGAGVTIWMMMSARTGYGFEIGRVASTAAGPSSSARTSLMNFPVTA